MATDILHLSKTSASPPTASFLLGCGAVFGILGGAVDLTRPLGENVLLYWLPALLLACAALLCALRSGRNYAVALPFLYSYFVLTWAQASGVYSLILSEESYTVRLATSDRRELLLFCVFFLLDLMTLLLFTFADRGLLWKTMSCVTCSIDIAFRTVSHVLLRGADVRIQPQIETVLLTLCAFLVLSAGLRERNSETASFGRLAVWETSPVPAIVCVAGGLYLACAGFCYLLYFLIPSQTLPAALSSIMESLGVSRAFLADGFGTMVLCFGLLGCLFSLLSKSLCGKANSFSEFRPAPITALALIGGYRVCAMVSMIAAGNPPSALWVGIVAAALAVDCTAVVLFCRADRSAVSRVAALVLCILAAIAAALNPYDVAPAPVTRAVFFAVMALLCTTLRADPFVRARVSAASLTGVLFGGLFSVASCGFIAYLWVRGNLTVETALLSLVLLGIGILMICLCARRLVSYENTDAILSDISSQPFISVPPVSVSVEQLNADSSRKAEDTVSDSETDLTVRTAEEQPANEIFDPAAFEDPSDIQPGTGDAFYRQETDSTDNREDTVSISVHGAEQTRVSDITTDDRVQTAVPDVTISLRGAQNDIATTPAASDAEQTPDSGNRIHNLMEDPVTQEESIASVLAKLNEMMKTISAKDSGQQSDDRSDKDSK